jgi:hypothetical protein
VSEPTEGYRQPNCYFEIDDNFRAPIYEEFPTVCICGSTRFEKETKQMAEALTFAGQVVLMVNCWSKKDALHEPMNPLDEEIKTMLDKIHKQKIRMADYVLVMNVGGYWGKSTQSEIEYAQKIGIPVKYLEPVIHIQSSKEQKKSPCQP